MSSSEVKVDYGMLEFNGKLMEMLSKKDFFKEDSIREQMSPSSGDVYNSMYGVNGEMKSCENVTKRLFADTSALLIKMSEKFEEMDNKIASEVGEKSEW